VYLSYLNENLAGKKREAIERRANIAFLLFDISHVLKPDGTFLYEQGPERTQTVVGLYAFATAADQYREVIDNLQARLDVQINNDRIGFPVNDKGKLTRTTAFTAEQPEWINLIREQMSAIDRVTENLKLKQKQLKRAEQTFKEGQADVLAKETELRLERAKSAKMLVDLQAIQARLFRSQLELANAAKINEELRRQIEEAEREQARIEGVVPVKGKAP